MDWQDWVGRSEVVEDVLTASLIAKYEATVGKVNSSDCAPLGLHWCLGAPRTPLDQLGVDGHPQKGGFLPPISLPRRMWASSEVAFLSPLRAGDQISRRSEVVSVKSKTGSSGELVFVQLVHDTSANGSRCIREKQTIVYRPRAEGALTLPAATGYEKSNAFLSETLRPNSQMLFRYSALTFNTHRIHYDSEYTQGEEGYPDLVVQGPLMASLLLRFASQNLGQDAIKTFSFRGLAPAYSGQDLHLCLVSSLPTCDLEVLGADGRRVMTGIINQSWVAT